MPGVRLGLPADGPGSVAGTGLRIAAFIVDGIVANLVAGVPYLFGVRYSTSDRGWIVLGAFLLVELILDTIYGQTLGKRMLGIRVIRVDGSGLASFPWILLRTVLLGVLVPAVVWDRDRRGLHDKAAGTVVVIDPNRAQPANGPSPARAATRAGVAPSGAARSQPVASDAARGPARQAKRVPAGGAKKRKKRR